MYIYYLILLRFVAIHLGIITSARTPTLLSLSDVEKQTFEAWKLQTMKGCVPQIPWQHVGS